MQAELAISAEGVIEAAQAIHPEFLNTPLSASTKLGGAEGAVVVLKNETATPIHSFKGRGTDYFAHCRAARVPRVVCASAGNFGQGLALAMGRRGGQAVVFAAANANPLKVMRMRELGAEVVLEGDDFDAANVAARRYAATEDLPFVEDAAWGEVAEGAGTIAREMTEAGVEFDAIYVPVGGGALINGIGTWLKHARPDVRVIGVCAEGAPALAMSWQRSTTVETARVETIADGIAIRQPVPAAVWHMRRVVDDFVLVSDAELIAAMRAVRQAIGIALEPSGAAGVAAIWKHAAENAYRRPATVLCGSNVPPDRYGAWFGTA